MMTIDDMLQELSQESPTTRRVLERVPADRLEWAPHPRSLTLGQLAYHVATIPRFLTEIALRTDFQAGTPIPRPTVASIDELLALHDESVALAATLLRDTGDEGLQATWPLRMGERVLAEVPRGWFLRSTMLNHWVHHRGELAVYLRLAGAKVPSIYGPSADESPF